MSLLLFLLLSSSLCPYYRCRQRHREVDAFDFLHVFMKTPGFYLPQVSYTTIFIIKVLVCEMKKYVKLLKIWHGSLKLPKISEYLLHLTFRKRCGRPHPFSCSQETGKWTLLLNCSNVFFLWVHQLNREFFPEKLVQKGWN